MLWTLVVILLVLWALGLAFKVASGLIHILLVIALVVIVFRLISGRRVVYGSRVRGPRVRGFGGCGLRTASPRAHGPAALTALSTAGSGPPARRCVDARR